MTKDKNILIHNIYYMLTYAFRDFRFNIDEYIAGEHFEEIHDLFAEILIRGVSSLLKHGLFKTYKNCEGELSTIRGKIYLYKTYEIGRTKPYQAYCSYDELSENNIYNQILKTTLLHILQCTNVSSFRKDTIRSMLRFFHEIDNINLQTIRWNIISFDRRNKSYQMLLLVCEFIQKSLLMTTENGTYKMTSLSDDNMCLLFQRFVLAYLQKHYPKTNARSEQISWNFKKKGDNDSILPIMQTDIMLSLGERTLIIDTKYYSHVLQTNYNKSTIHSSHLYQLYAYVNNYDTAHTGNVDGMLLYAKVEEDFSPDIENEFSEGNKIYVRTLDLYQDFQGICAQLEKCIDI